MVRVKIRHEEAEKSLPLCEIAPDQLGWLVNEIRIWGVYCEGGGPESITTSGQFVIEDGEAFFEVIVHDPEPPEPPPAKDKKR